MTSSSSSPRFQVFISHAGEDKTTIAIPLRNMLRDKGITAFVDEEDMPPGVDAKQEMFLAMKTAHIGVIILSPEFVAKEWPMKELLCFLKRRKDARSLDASYPDVIPLFYRLSVSETHGEPRLGRKRADGTSLYHASRFFERMNRGDPEADIQTIENALGELRGIMGVRNDVNVTNGSEYGMSDKRELLLQQTCDAIVEALAKQNNSLQEDNGRGLGHPFHRYFAPAVQLNAVLDFRTMNTRVDRMTPEARIKQQVLAHASSRVFAIVGIGGVGKSTILRGLAKDEDVRKEFSDGVHIMSLGMDATTTTLFRKVCKILRAAGCTNLEHQLREGNDVNEAIDKALSWFGGKRCAFLIDDAWTLNIGFGLLSSLCQLVGPEQRSTVIFTTREREIASLAPKKGITCLRPREPRGEASRSILFCHAGTPVCGDHIVEDSITEVLGVCGGLPVSLAAAGKGVKMLMIDMESQEENAWREYLIHLRTCREQLIEENVSDYGNLYATFSASIALLDQQQEEKRKFSTPLSFAKMYRRLCVLLKQDKVPASMLKHLWELESVNHAKIVGMRFVQVGLADRVDQDVDSESVWHLRLHDSLHDFAREEAKRHEDVVEAHEILLGGYSGSDPELWSTEEKRTKWWSKGLEGDGYLHINLCRHLREASRIGELIELLKTPEWLARQLQMNGVLSIDADFVLGIETLSKTNENDDSEDEEVLRLIRGALNLSSGFVSRNAKELSFQLHGRLIGCRERCDGIGKYLDRMERGASETWLRSIHPFLEGPDSSTERIIPVGGLVWCMAVIGRKKLVACGYGDGRIAVVDLMRGSIERKWSAHDSAVTAIAVAKDGKRAVTGSADKTAKSWDLDTRRYLITFRGHTDVINSVAIVKDGRMAVSGSSDGTVQVWDTGTEGALAVFNASSRVLCVAFLPGEQRVVSGEDDGNLRVWNLPGGLQVAGLYTCVSLGVSDSVTCVAVTPDGKRVVSGSGSGTIWSTDTKSLTKHPISTPRVLPDGIGCISVSGKCGRIVCGYDSGKVRVWNIDAESQTCQTLPGNNSWVCGVSFLLETGVIASCSSYLSFDGLVRMWDLSKSGESDTVLPQQPFNTYLLTFTPDSKCVLSISEDHSIRIWNASSGRQQGSIMRGNTKRQQGSIMRGNILLPIPSFSERITDLAFSRDGRMCATVSEDCTLLRLWDMKSGKQFSEQRFWTGGIRCVALTPSGDCAIIVGGVNTVHLWQLTGLGEGNHFTLQEHKGWVQRVLVSSDGLRIISMAFDYGEDEGEILVWDLQSRESVKTIDVDRRSNLPDREIMALAGEATEDAGIPVPIDVLYHSREVLYGQGKNAGVIGTMEADIDCWAISPGHNKLCVALTNRSLVFLEVKTPSMEVETPSMELETPSMEVETPSMELETPSMEVETPSNRAERQKCCQLA